MARRTCEKCLYGDKCGESRVCEYYAPLYAEEESSLMTEAVNNRRSEFRRAWARYISGEDTLAYYNTDRDLSVERGRGV